MKQLFFVLIIFSSLGAICQDTNYVLKSDTSGTPPLESVKKLPVNNTENYLEIGLGVGYSQFRDFATSPLFYSGFPFSLDLAFRIDGQKNEKQFGLQASYGSLSALINGSYAQSSVVSASLFYQQLYIFPQVSNNKWKYKVGGQINASGNYRYNPSLQNNSVGVEMVNTLFASGKVVLDVSRLRTKEKKCWFMHSVKEPRFRLLDFQLNIGLLNNSFRNGYAYIDQSSVLNDPKDFGGYKYSWFTGFRMSSSLRYIIYLKNKNAVQFSYVWDAYTTGGDANRFEFGSHFLKFTLLFNTK
jgi:hypothetical protein